MLGFLAALAAMLASAPQSAPTPPPQSASAPALYIVIYRPGPAWIAGKPMNQQKLGPHVAYIRGLLADGRLVAGGPFTDASEGGMAILRAASLADARAILTADPAVRGGILAADVRPWEPRFASKRPLASWRAPAQSISPLRLRNCVKGATRSSEPRSVKWLSSR